MFGDCVHEVVITGKGNYQTRLRGYYDINIWKNQFTSREVIIQIAIPV